jgi:hypothetical protein
MNENQPKDVSARVAEITLEVATRDIQKAMATFGSVGTGSEIDRAAQLVSQSLQVLRRRVHNPAAIRLLYVDNPAARTMLPDIALSTVDQLSSGAISPEEAESLLDQASEKYGQVFEGMGVKPEVIAVLFFKSPSESGK